MKNSKKLAIEQLLNEELKNRGWSIDRWGNAKSPSETYRIKFMTNVIRLEGKGSKTAQWINLISYGFANADLLLRRIDLIKEKDPTQL